VDEPAEHVAALDAVCGLRVPETRFGLLSERALAKSSGVHLMLLLAV
jgi:hypothetical protein